MSTQPSFAALYRQSRYARADGDPQRTTRQNRQELFAVAGVAFVMKHDETFRRDFLERVCGVRKEDLSMAYEIEVQPNFHADLRIRCSKRRALYIVEFKVGAQLQPKQNPSNTAAFLKASTGYGWIISNAPEYTHYAQRTYIVLQNWSAFADGEVNGIRVCSRTWRHLIRHNAEESSIACDLLDTLGGWGIASLRFRHTTRMKKAQHTRHAADIFQIVTAIAEELDIRPSKYDFDVQPASGGGAYFGLNLASELKRFSKLQKLAVKCEDGLGWTFGFTASLPKLPRPHRTRRSTTQSSAWEQSSPVQSSVLKDTSASVSAATPWRTTRSGLPAYSTRFVTSPRSVTASRFA